MNNFNIVRYLN